MFSRLMIAVATTVLTIVTSCLSSGITEQKCDRSSASVYPFKLGDFTITVLSDGTLPGSTYAAVEYEPNRNRSPASEKLSD